MDKETKAANDTCLKLLDESLEGFDEFQYKLECITREVPWAGEHNNPEDSQRVSRIRRFTELLGEELRDFRVGFQKREIDHQKLVKASGG